MGSGKERVVRIANMAFHSKQRNEVFSDPLHVSRLDQRFSYFEERWITVGTIESEGVYER